MEKKKALLIKVLTKLKPHRNLAEGFLALMESKYVSDEILDKLIGALQDAMETVVKKMDKMKFKKVLKLIKKIEMQENQNDKKMTDENLDKLLENI